MKSQSYIAKPGVYKSGKVEGRKVTDILLDTGCSRTVVRQDLVPEQKKVEGEAVAICCAHGDTVLYPLAQVEILEDKSLKLKQLYRRHCPCLCYWGLMFPVFLTF